MDAQKLKIQKIEGFLKQFQSYIALIIIVVVATLINIKDGENVFLSVPNIMNVLRAVSETGIIAIGMTMILILGDIDLSVGSIGFHRLRFFNGKKRTGNVSGSTFKSFNRRAVRTF